jgi:hypothetical protein
MTQTIGRTVFGPLGAGDNTATDFSSNVGDVVLMQVKNMPTPSGSATTNTLDFTVPKGAVLLDVIHDTIVTFGANTTGLVLTDADSGDTIATITNTGNGTGRARVSLMDVDHYATGVTVDTWTLTWTLSGNIPATAEAQVTILYRMVPATYG